MNDFPYFHLYAKESPREQYARLCAYQPDVATAEHFRVIGVQYTPAVNRWIRGGRWWLQRTSPPWFLFDSLGDFYIEDVRMRARKTRESASPYDMWQASGERVASDKEGVEAQRLRVYNTFDEVGQFRLSWAASVFAVLETLTDVHRVLDPCAGWGDRLLASMARGYEYTGCDPNTALRAGHTRMIAEFGDRARHRIIYEPAEDVVALEEATFDVVFTSPPFFGLEHYSDASTQASQRYTTFSAWWTYFMGTLLRRGYASLRANGLIALHIIDSRQGAVVDAVHRTLCGQYHMTYVGVVGLCCGKGRTWPVWIYRK